MTPQEVIARLEHTPLLAYVSSGYLRVRQRGSTDRIVDLPINDGKVDAGYICHLLSEVD